MEATKRPWTAHILDCPKNQIGRYVQQCVDNSGGDEFHFISAPHEDGGDADIAHVGNGPRGKDNAALIVRAVNTFDQAREALKEMLKAYDQLLPGIGKISCKDYQNINEAPIKARQVLAAMEATS